LLKNNYACVVYRVLIWGNELIPQKDSLEKTFIRYLENDDKRRNEQRESDKKIKESIEELRKFTSSGKSAINRRLMEYKQANINVEEKLKEKIKSIVRRDEEITIDIIRNVHDKANLCNKCRNKVKQRAKEYIIECRGYY